MIGSFRNDGDLSAHGYDDADDTARWIASYLMTAGRLYPIIIGVQPVLSILALAIAVS